jgi:hypothetical protein
MNREIEKIADSTIMEAKRFLLLHKPPPEISSIERIKARGRFFKEWFLKEMGYIPKNAILVDPSPELAKKARLSQTRDVTWPADMQSR